MGVSIMSNQLNITCDTSRCKRWNNADVTINTNSVKRSLFGPVNHEEFMSFYQKEMSQMEEEKRLAWNFDFSNERPLKGSFKWEKVEKSCNKSVVVKSPKKVTKCKTTRRSPLKSLDVRNKQTTITEYISISKSIVKQRVEDTTTSKK